MPQDPLKHRYGPSVMAIYRSAWRIFSAARISYRRVPTIAARMGVLWSYALAGSVCVIFCCFLRFISDSSATQIVMCLLVIRAPTTNLAKSSLTELDQLCALFEEAASQSQIASNNLVSAAYSGLSLPLDYVPCSSFRRNHAQRWRPHPIRTR